MGLRKMCPTRKLTITASKKLYDEIEERTKGDMRFPTMSEYTDYAIRFFIDCFYDDIAIAIGKEIARREKKGESTDILEFASDYSGETISWQATIPLGTDFQLNTLQNIFKFVNATNMIRYSVEYYLKCSKRKDYITAKFVRGENPGLPDKPEIKFKPSLKKGELNLEQPSEIKE